MRYNIRGDGGSARMRCRSNNRDRFLRMRSGLLLLAALLAGTVSAQYSERTTYNDEACQDLNSTLVVNGILGSAGVTPFDTCSNISSGSSQYFGTYECADSEVTLSTYDNEDCSGTSVETSTVYNGSCTESQISSCTAGEPGWDISSNWIVEATFYSNQTCSMATGETSTYTMAQFMDLYEEDGSCQSIDFGGVPLFSAIRCMDGKLGWVVYDESDSTCSSDVVMVVTDVLGCVASTEAAGPYLGGECTGIAETSSSSDNDYLGGYEGLSTSDDSFSWGDDSNGFDWEVLTNWTVQTTSYSDENCNASNGQTKNFTMSQFLDLYYESEGCQNFEDLNYAVRCIDGKLGTAYYSSSDSTCSLDPEFLYKDDLYSCGLSYIDFESYLSANCTGNMDTSSWSDDDDWDGSDDDDWDSSDDDDWDGSDDSLGISWNDGNGLDWEVLTSWTVQTIMYSDENCSVANGQTKNFTMSQFIDLYHEIEGCQNYGSLSVATRCIDGKVGTAYYNESDSTCSVDPYLLYKDDSYKCALSSFDDESYLSATCTGNMDTSNWSDDDDWDWSDDDDRDGSSGFFGIPLADNNASIVANSTVQATFYSDENCSVANGQTSEFTPSEFLELHDVNETCLNFLGDVFLGFRCVNGMLGWAVYNDSTCSLDAIGVFADEFGCHESPIGSMSTLGAYFQANCTGIVDDSDKGNDESSPTADGGNESNGGDLSLHLPGISSGNFVHVARADNNDSIFANSTVQATFYSDENCSVANGQTSDVTSSELLELYDMNETCLSVSDGVFWGFRCINGNIGWAVYHDSACSLDVIATISEEFGCHESPNGSVSSLGAHFQANCTGIVDSNGGGLSLHLAGFIGFCSWSIAAAATTALATALV